MSAIPAGIVAPRMKSAEAFRTISEVAVELDVPQHVLRFWETRFTQVKPVKRAGGRRYYRPEDVDLLRGIRALLYSDGLTIKGVQKVLRERGLRQVCEIGRGEARFTPPPRTVEIPDTGDVSAVWSEEATHARAVIANLARVHAEEPVVHIEAAIDEETRVRLEILLADLQQSKARLRAAAGR
jgi:DNA-binding transcriptional MerR regulator